MAPITKIVFLHEGHFSKAYYEMFGIKTLEDIGFEVEVWNFIPFLKKAVFQQATPPDPIKWAGYHVFETKHDAAKAVAQLPSSTMVICGLHYTLATYPFYRLLSKKKIRYATNLAMALPSGTTGTMTSLTQKIQRITFSRLFSYVFQRVPFQLLGVKPVDLIFATGDKFFRHGYPSTSQSEILWVHFHDYDKYLTVRDIPSQHFLKTAVFLDEYLAFHPDNIDMGVPSVNAEDYYPLLCNFFSFLEKEHGFQITIAAHPRSKYEEMPDLFEGRPVIRGKTAELVRDADCVIMHQSMSINYAVLFKKPLIFITTDQVNRCLIEDPTIEWLAEFFEKRVHNLNKTLQFDMGSELRVKEEAYKQYQNDYIKKTGSEEKMFWQIVADRLKSMQ